MPPSQIYEIIGYIASVLIAVSLMMRSILRLRVINLVGAIAFTVYGLLIQAYPVAAVNFVIVLIDLYYLAQMLAAREFFRLLEIRADSEYLRSFLDFYAEDIRRSQPGFVYDPARSQLVFFILRNMVPAGLFIGEIRSEGDCQDGCLHVRLDYAIPGYRDLKIGRFLYNQHAGDFRERGLQKIITAPGEASHARYLRQMGFTGERGPAGEERYCLSL